MTARYSFADDYSDGAHREILAAVVAADDGQEVPYGGDSWSRRAAERITATFGVDGDVHFLPTGTAANLVCIAAMLRPHEGIVAAGSAHIATSETGAIEATGHRILTVPAEDGRLTPTLVDRALLQHRNEHTVKPGAVFLSQATELGTVYTRDELSAVVAHAHGLGLRVLLDGARLSMALASDAAGGMTPAELGASAIDVMVVGGTKNGGLYGEAVVVVDDDLRQDFRYLVKQRGAMLAKGRYAGAQFARFFDDDRLWEALGAQAVASARRLAAGLVAAGAELVAEPQANQAFCALPPDAVASLEEEYRFHRRRLLDDGRVVVRFVCSWATPAEAVDGLVERVGSLL